MSWLVAGSTGRNDVLALHEPLAAAHEKLLDGIWNDCVDPRILEYCRLRTATLLGNSHAWQEPRTPAAVAAGLDEAVVAELAKWPTHDGFDPAARACLGLAEQYVIDIHGVTDEQVSDLTELIGPDGVITLTTALAAWEITHRFDNAILTSTSGDN